MDDLKLYRTMLTVRLLEDELQKLCLLGEAGDLHFNKGQEAIAVGVCAALRPDDFIVTHHRTIAHSIAKGIPLKPLVAELLGKATGINGGKAGEMHLMYPRVKYMFTFQLVGTCVPVSAGLAWAVKNFLKESSIVACFFGDAATANGQTHEGLNIASVRDVPLLLICENNGLAGNIRKEYYLPTSTVAERARAYGIEAKTIDGNMIAEVFDNAREAAEYVRRASRPYLLEMQTTRLSWHKQGMPDARPKDEISELSKRDPLLWQERRLNMTREERELLVSRISSEIQNAIADARAAPNADLELSKSAGQISRAGGDFS